jgi:hypothetical protein
VAAEGAVSARKEVHLVPVAGLPAGPAPPEAPAPQLFVVPHPKGVALEMRFHLDGQQLSAFAVMPPAAARQIAADIVAAADRMPFEVPHG